jgi:hypothetical protein
LRHDPQPSGARRFPTPYRRRTVSPLAHENGVVEHAHFRTETAVEQSWVSNLASLPISSTCAAALGGRDPCARRRSDVAGAARGPTPVRLCARCAVAPRGTPPAREDLRHTGGAGCRCRSCSDCTNSRWGRFSRARVVSSPLGCRVSARVSALRVEQAESRRSRVL